MFLLAPAQSRPTPPNHLVHLKLHSHPFPIAFSHHSIMEKLSYFGCTSNFYRVRPGVLVKNPSEVWKPHPARWQECLEAISLEHQIFKHLGHHRTIVKYVHVSRSCSVHMLSPCSPILSYITLINYQ